MANKKSPETKLAEAVNELGYERAESIFRFMKALNEQVAPAKTRKKSEKPVSSLLSNLPERSPEKEAEAS